MDEKKSLSRLQRLCSRAEYCSRDIYRKALADMEGDGEAAARIVASLVGEGYVDDLRYSSAFAREKAALQGWGPVKIRFQLRSKGISDSIIETALGEVDPGASSSRLDRLLAARAKSLKGDPQAKLKLLKFALGRGYEYSAALDEKILHFVQDDSRGQDDSGGVQDDSGGVQDDSGGDQDDGGDQSFPVQ